MKCGIKYFHDIKIIFPLNHIPFYNNEPIVITYYLFGVEHLSETNFDKMD